MSGIRKFAISIVSIGLILSLQALILALVIVPTVTDRQAVKEIFVTESAYEAFIQTIKNTDFDQLVPTSDISDADQAQFNEDKTALFDRIDQVVSYEKYQQMSTQTTDGFYDWFEGKTDKPQFEIVLAPNREETVKLLEPVFIDRYNALPACPADFQFSADFSPLSTECRPAGVTDQDVTQYIKESAVDPDFDDLFTDITLRSEDFDINPSQTETVQRAYGLAKASPIVFGGITVALSIFLALLVTPLASKLKAFGIVFLIVSIPMLISSLILRIFPRISLGSMIGAVSGNTALASFLDSIARIAIDRTMIYSFILCTVGIGLLIGSRFVKQKRKTQTIQPIVDQEQFYNQNNKTTV